MYDTLALWASVAIAIFALGYTIYTNRSKATAQRVRDIEMRVDKKADKAETARLFECSDETDRRVTKLESDMRHMPDKDAAHKLEMSVQKLSGEVGILTEQLKPVTAMAGRIQDALIEHISDRK